MSEVYDILNQKAVPKSSVYELICCALFTALMAVGAYIKIMIPLGIFEVTISLQLFFALIAGCVLGRKWGVLSIICYIFLGLIGLPIFAHGGGIYYMMKPTFGFIIGFAAAALTAGAVYEALNASGRQSVHRQQNESTGNIKNSHRKKQLKRVCISCIAGEAAYYICGLIYYYVIFNFVLTNGMTIGLKELFLIWFLSTVLPDTVITLMAGFMALRITTMLKHIRTGV
ncbi:MAG: biotin transporter BioY [Lachnospiraceae bacterium]|nr:biotin transporter BioY [Lachnospiraceae bacterium]